MSQPDAPSAYLSDAQTAPAYWSEDILWIVHATSEQTGGAYSLIEEFCPKGSGPPPHYHDQDEGFHLISGDITFIADGKTLQASDGFFVSIPRGSIHSFRVDSDTAHILNFYTPGGFERTITELGQPAKTRTIPPEGIDKPLSKDQAMALFKEIGMHPVDEPDRLRQ